MENTSTIQKPFLNVRTSLCLLGVFVAYVSLRLLAWRRTVLLEDHDSVGNLNDIRTFLASGISAFTQLDADSSLVYPSVSALFSLPGWSIETGARLASLLPACLLFFALIGIGRRFAGPAAIIAGLVLLAFNPELISLSFAILTEPLYTATAYLGLWLLWLQLEKPSLWGAALVGLVFALAFLNRIEGLLFLAFAPAVLGVACWRKFAPYDGKRVLQWSIVFGVCFSALAGLQVWRVSDKMGTFALNGRQAWHYLLQSTEVGATYAEKIYGLHYSPNQVNMLYVKDNFSDFADDSAQMGLAVRIKEYAFTVVVNLYDLYNRQLGVLFGFPTLILFAFGLLSLYESGRRPELLFLVAFIGLGLLAPLLHTVVSRHIMVVAPIILLVAGIGGVHVAEIILGRSGGHHSGRNWLIATVLLVVIAGWGLQLRRTFNPPKYDLMYDPAALEEPAKIIKQVASELGHAPRLSSRTSYLAYFADAQGLAIPYTDYDAFVRYCALNEVDLVFLQHNLIQQFPFLKRFREGDVEDHFQLLYRGADTAGETLELYRRIEQDPAIVSEGEARQSPH